MINAHWLAIMFACISALANSAGDAMKFAHPNTAGKDHDFLWHVLKWPIDRLSLLLCGVFSWPVLYEFVQAKDLWHYTARAHWWFSGMVLSILIWWPHYQFWKKYIRRKYEVAD